MALTTMNYLSNEWSKSSEGWFEASHVGLTSLPEHPSSSAGTGGISKQNLVLPSEIEQQDLRAFLPQSLSLCPHSNHTVSSCTLQRAAALTCGCFALGESFQWMRQQTCSSATGGCGAPCNRPPWVMLYPKHLHHLQAERTHQPGNQADLVKGDRGTMGNRQCLDINLLATCVWQTSAVIYPGITSEKKEPNSHLLLHKKIIKQLSIFSLKLNNWICPDSCTLSPWDIGEN